ncbi:hypothetical protein [Amycolatopsis panacis]|uniref:Uncharacterized protein n=1 Tax=Amycolatopsis panacis TaxID=2340917 RepID=A0A419I6F2_9PSEU|nr:hypothetical protein [Amycolatopsis panacis]RJQ87024.1 hypothetical protein D5S19_10240 [Amycolatopsis panacis]
MLTGLPVRQDSDWTLDHLKDRLGNHDDFGSYDVVPGAQLRPEHVAHRSVAGAQALHLFETAARRQAVAVACACGLGRLREEQAKPSVDAMIAGAESAPYAV